MEFGDRLKLLREEKGLTQQDIADILKVGRPTIAGYETKRKQPDYDKINILADYFNVSLDYLLGRSEIRNPYSNIQQTSESLAERFLDLLIDSGEIKTKEDLTTDKVFKILNKIFSELKEDTN